MKSFKQFILEYAGPSDIRKAKAFTGVGFRHHPDDNEKVHKDLLSKGFKLTREYTQGSANISLYKNDKTGQEIEHIKAEDQSTVKILSPSERTKSVPSSFSVPYNEDLEIDPEIQKTETEIGFRHSPKDNEKVHQYLIDNGFEQLTSSSDGSFVYTKYKNSSGKEIEHVKGKNVSFVDFIN